MKTIKERDEFESQLKLKNKSNNLLKAQRDKIEQAFAEIEQSTLQRPQMQNLATKRSHEFSYEKE